ncbi:NFACT RNA binding domain-containing protein, partial [Bacteroidota bacterium]
NPNHSPVESINYYFNKAKDEKKNYISSQELFIKTESEFYKILDIKNKIDGTEDVEGLMNIKSSTVLNHTKKSEFNFIEKHVKLRTYILLNNYRILVGRDSKSNDLLTTKIAKPNDYWFHARSLAGSHVVLRNEKSKETVPKNIIKNVASIAAYYSKGKTSKIVPVSYTFKKYIRKRKDMEPGQVIISREKVIIVKPEIPSNCIEITN